MINKIAFSKAIKETKKKDRVFNSDEFISNGYWIFKKNQVANEILLKEFLTEKNFIHENKKIELEYFKMPDFQKYIDESLKEQEFEFSGMIQKYDSYECYIFVGKEDNKTVLIDRKFAEIIDDLKHCIIFGGKSKLCGLTFFSEKNEFIGLILPIREKNSEFIVTRKEENN